jgi:hypothetical protein
MPSKNHIVIFITVLALGYFGVAAASTAPLVNIVNITKVVSPSSLPVGGGEVSFTYKVTNAGTISLSDVTVSDNKCSAMSGELGDRNANRLLDPSEVWIYTCRTTLIKTTTNTATVTAYANDLKVTNSDTITVDVTAPGLPDNGTNPNTLNVTVVIWGVLGGILAVLIAVFFVIRKKQ